MSKAKNRVEELEEMLDIAHEEIMNLENRVDRLESEYESRIEIQERTINNLQQRLNEIDERTDLLKVVEKADETTADQRSASLLIHLKQQAKREKQRDRAPKASMNHAEAMDALHYPEDLERTLIYSDWDRCVRWVGDEDVCWTDYQNDQKRLFLDLDGVDEDAISHVISHRGGKL